MRRVSKAVSFGLNTVISAIPGHDQGAGVVPQNVCLNVSECVPVATLLVGIKIGEAWDGCWPNSGQTGDALMGEKKVQKLLPMCLLTNILSHDALQHEKNRIFPDPSCCFEGCSFKSFRGRFCL